MKSVIAALIAAFNTMLHPRILLLTVWPALASLLLWLGAALYFWGSWADGLASLLQSSALGRWMAPGAAPASHYLIVFVLVLLLLSAIYLTALMITAVFAMPVMVGHISRRYYPELERKRGGTMAGSISNTAVAVAVYCVGWVLSMPLWLFPPLAITISIILMAYLNQRLFPYDALAEHASKDELGKLAGRSSAKRYLLGGAVGLLQFVPVLNLLSAVFAGLAFVHLSLAELKQLRGQG